MCVGRGVGVLHVVRPYVRPSVHPFVTVWPQRGYLISTACWQFLIRTVCYSSLYKYIFNCLNLPICICPRNYDVPFP